MQFLYQLEVSGLLAGRNTCTAQSGAIAMEPSKRVAQKSEAIFEELKKMLEDFLPLRTSAHSRQGVSRIPRVLAG